MNYTVEVVPKPMQKGSKDLVIPPCIQEIIDIEGGSGSWCLMMIWQSFLGIKSA